MRTILIEPGIVRKSVNTSNSEVALRYLWPSCLCLLLLQPVVGEDRDAAFYDPNAVLVNVTETDLNRILSGAFYSAGGPHFRGTSERVSSSLSGFHYEARFSEPLLELGPGGSAGLSFTLEQADLRVDRVEGKLIRRVSCENLGASLHPGKTIDVSLDLQLVLEDRDLRIIPRHAVMSDARRAFRLVKPSRCRKNIVPEFLLWWLGKPKLRKKLDNLDEMLLAGMKRSAARLEQDEDGLLNKRVRIGERELWLYPRRLETGERSIWVTLAGGEGEGRDDHAAPPGRLQPSSSQSWIGVSEATINAVLELAYTDWLRPSSRPSGTLGKLFRSHALFTLVPGLRDLDQREGLTWSVRFTAPPKIELLVDSRVAPAGSSDDTPPARDPERPLILLRLSGVELQISRRASETQELLGTLLVENGTVGAVPYANRLGGISFDVVRNEWRVSSSGVEFNESLLAATIQELIFGELFETQYEPLARGALTVGRTRFEPTAIRVVDGYLVIEFGDFDPGAPTRTDTPLASR